MQHYVRKVFSESTGEFHVRGYKAGFFLKLQQQN